MPKPLIQSFKSIPYPLVLAGLMLLRIIAAARADLVPDESYYWLWAQHPALGYYDHPPMVAWWIGTSTALFGSSPLAVRLPFLLSFVALGWVMFDTARRLFGDSVARRSVLWLNACLMLSIGSVIATPDPPSVLMWALCLWALARLQKEDKGWWWLVFGLFAGLGLDAKYTNFFLGLGVVLWFVLDKPARRWLKTPWPWFGAVITLIAFAPNLRWNVEHHYLTLYKQFGRLDAGHVTAQYLIEFVFSQPLLLNPLIFVFTVFGVKAWLGARSDRALSLLVALPLPLLVYMLVHVFHDRVQGNWTAPVFPGLVLLAAGQAEEISGNILKLCRKFAPALGIGLASLALIYLALSDSAASSIGAAGLNQGWDKVASQLRLKQAQSHAEWIATTDYDSEGELSYHLPGVPVVAVAERQRYNWPQPDAGFTDKTALIVVAADHSFDLKRCFDGLTDFGSVSRLKKPSPRSDFHLYYGVLRQAGCDVSSPAMPVAPAEMPAAPHGG